MYGFGGFLPGLAENVLLEACSCDPWFNIIKIFILFTDGGGKASVFLPNNIFQGI
jgi:hypothetical protein